MSKNTIPLSKFLALVLRHQPQEFGIQLDNFGYSSLETVWDAITNKFGNKYQYQDLLTVVEGDKYGKKRYEIVNGNIRAMYGHSSQEITYPKTVPPEFLYHGTSPQAAKIIRQEGLKSLERQYVHLTTNVEIANRVGIRHADNAILLTIRAKEAHNAGIVFHHAEIEHYLTKAVPPEFIGFP